MNETEKIVKSIYDNIDKDNLKTPPKIQWKNCKGNKRKGKDSNLRCNTCNYKLFNDRYR